jgi:hypothetical protein
MLWCGNSKRWQAKMKRTIRILQTLKIYTMTDMYTCLTFRNHEEFEMYKNATNMGNRNLALRMNDCKLTVMIKTELPLPTGTLTAKTESGKEIEIRVSSGYRTVVGKCTYPHSLG